MCRTIAHSHTDLDTLAHAADVLSMVCRHTRTHSHTPPSSQCARSPTPHGTTHQPHCGCTAYLNLSNSLSKSSPKSAAGTRQIHAQAMLQDASMALYCHVPSDAPPACAASAMSAPPCVQGASVIYSPGPAARSEKHHFVSLQSSE